MLPCRPVRDSNRINYFSVEKKEVSGGMSDVEIGNRSKSAWFRGLGSVSLRLPVGDGPRLGRNTGDFVEVMDFETLEDFEYGT